MKELLQGEFSVLLQQVWRVEEALPHHEADAVAEPPLAAAGVVVPSEDSSLHHGRAVHHGLHVGEQVAAGLSSIFDELLWWWLAVVDRVVWHGEQEGLVVGVLARVERLGRLVLRLRNAPVGGSYTTKD